MLLFMRGVVILPVLVRGVFVLLCFLLVCPEGRGGPYNFGSHQYWQSVS
jgi:hypothetical protein